MKFSWQSVRAAGAVAVLSAVSVLSSAAAPIAKSRVMPPRPVTHNFDVRSVAAPSAALKQSQRSAALGLAVLRAHSPGASVRLSAATAAPELVSAGSGPLARTIPGASAFGQVQAFLRDNRAVYGLSAKDIDNLAVLGESHRGLPMLRVEQTVGGKRVFLSESRFLFDRQGNLWRSVGTLVPQVAGSATGVAGVSAETGLVSAMEGVGIGITAASLSRKAPVDGKLILASNGSAIAGDVSAELGWFPLSPGVVVPAWRYITFTSGDADWNTIVDARNGSVLWQKNMREYASAHDARFRVYVQADGTTPADSPAPQSPNNVPPGSGTQFSEIAPTIVSMHTAMDAVASPNGWIDDCPGGVCTANETQTLGNNALICLDRVGGNGAGGANLCDVAASSVLDGNGRPTGNPDANARNRDFLGTAPRDFQTNFLPPPQGNNPEAGQTATGNGNNGTLAVDQFRRGAVTHLFYLTNWYHDQLFNLGFDEENANFQNTNFSGMGLGNDRVNGDAQDSTSTDNANFSTPPDGTSGRMQMYRFTGPTIDRDGGLDAEVVLHELSHGTSNRLVGNGSGLLWDAARGMGEGWSDFYALSLLNNTNADDPARRYPSGAYATYKLTGTGGFTDNYVSGIRRFPYTSDKAVNPLTFADVDDVTNDLSGGIAPTTVTFNLGGAFELHNIGEVWAETLWDIRQRVIVDPSGAGDDVPTGNHTMLQLVTDGLKMTPDNPSLTDARDAILEADCATNACANEDSIWGGFANRGLGWGSSAPFSVMGRYATASHMAVHESFSAPFLDVANTATDVVVDDSFANNNGTIDVGEAVKLTVTLTNPWRGASKGVGSATATLTSSTAGVTILDGSSTYGAIAPQGTASGDSFLVRVDGPVCGDALDFTLTTVSNLGTTATDFRLRVGTPNGMDPVVTYTSGSVLPFSNARPRGVNSPIAVTDDFEIADVDLRVDSVTYPTAGDLAILLRSPGGVGNELVTLIAGLNGVGGANITNMVIDGDAPADAAHDMVQATNAQAPYTNTYRPVYNSPWATLVNPTAPEEPVDDLSRYDGASTKGTWNLNVSDIWTIAQGGGSNADGTLNGWSLLVTPRHFDCTAFVPAVHATKAVSGTYTNGGTVTYTVVLTNNMARDQADNAGDEFTDVLPAGVNLVSASASAGTAVATPGTNTVTWNGVIPLAGSVTVTITATVGAATAAGTVISNQGSVAFDADGDATNDGSGVTDDPSVGGSADATDFTVPVDTTPDSFTFTDVTGATPHLYYYADMSPLFVSGINTAATVSITGNASAQFSVGNGAFTGTATTVSNGQRVRVKLLSSSASAGTVSATLDIGGVSATWNVTTGADTTPNAFTFTDLTGVMGHTFQYSNTFAVAGINAAAAVSLTGSALVSINSGAFAAAPATVNNGDKVRLRVVSADLASGVVNSTLTIGGVSDTFTVTTDSVLDTTPDAFTVVDQTGVAKHAYIFSNTFKVTGINTSTAVGVTGPALVSVNGAAFTATPPNVQPNDTVRLRVISSSSGNTAVSSTLTIGGGSDIWDVTTGP
jgi:uncharacterized repeat protein (TIGR01451 family)